MSAAKKVIINDRMQRGYVYVRSGPVEKTFTRLSAAANTETNVGAWSHK